MKKRKKIKPIVKNNTSCMNARSCDLQRITEKLIRSKDNLDTILTETHLYATMYCTTQGDLQYVCEVLYVYIHAERVRKTRK